MPSFPEPPPLPRVYRRGDYTAAQFREVVKDRKLVRVGWGGYLPEPTGPPWERERQRALGAIASVRGQLGDDVVICGPSAALLHGLWLGTWDGKVHVASPRRSGTSRPGVKRHLAEIPDADIVELAGLRVTSATRTVLDCARMLHPRWGLTVADSALRMLVKPSRDNRVGGETAMAEIRAGWLDRLEEFKRSPGIRVAIPVVTHASGYSESPGETGLRWVPLSRGLPPGTCQFPVVAGGRRFHLDLGWDVPCRLWLPDEPGRLVTASGVAVLGEEYDGEEKYRPNNPANPLAAVVREKDREDWLREAGAFLKRRRGHHLLDPDALYAAIAARFPRKIAEAARPIPGLMAPGSPRG